MQAAQTDSLYLFYRTLLLVSQVNLNKCISVTTKQDFILIALIILLLL